MIDSIYIISISIIYYFGWDYFIDEGDINKEKQYVVVKVLF